MALPKTQCDREHERFVECNNEVAVRTKLCQEPGETVNVSVNPSSTPTIYNLSAPTSGVEVSQALTDNTKQLLVRVRGASMQIAFVSGQSGTNFITIPAGASLFLKDLKTNSLTLYLQTNKNGQTIEIMEWV